MMKLETAENKASNLDIEVRGFTVKQFLDVLSVTVSV